MLLRGIGTIVGLAATGALGVGYLMSTSAARVIVLDFDRKPPFSTLALAPLSLGNPTAATGPETTGPQSPLLASVPKGPPPLIETRIKVRSGDTLAAVLTRAGASNSEAHSAIKAFSTKHDPRYIRAGQELKVSYRPGSAEELAANAGLVATPGSFHGFAFSPAYDKEVRVSKDTGPGFKVAYVLKPLKRHVSRAEGVITSSLYVAGRKAGLTGATLAELIRAFSWDVDFQRGIRRGDKFEIMYNLIINEDGKIVRSDEILFAALTLQDQRQPIYRFSDGHGGFEYFDTKGNSAQKALMRTPIDGARLSSGFGRRRHPVLGYTKMHRGVDFAAPRGTPIYAAGNGIIDFAGRKGGYGKYIRIRHNGTYQTAYAHMSGYGRGMRTGRRVRQGQIIGYVGTTGRSTGNHLHYEILRNGRQLNPMRMKMPSGRKLLGKELTRFHAFRKALDTRYKLLPKGRALVAQN